jgi:two-component sensor histidine kinase
VVDELNHRLKNKLAVVHAVLRHELRDQDDALARIFDRLRAHAAADELLARRDTDSVDIREILAVELSHYGEARITAEGDRVQLPAKHAATLTLIFHELATNAAKHGALKSPKGEVSIRWRRESSVLKIAWSERGGSPVTAPQRRGFGTGLFRRALDPFHGTVSTSFEPAGIRCEICLDVPSCASDGHGQPAGVAAPVTPQARMWGRRPA